jgi:putative restriction endonuclease
MRFWVGVTDKAWFDRLRTRGPEEVNFWQPSAAPVAAFLEPGTPFLFKLHSPDNYIVGGGFFVRFSALPARLAWEAFGEKNGVPDYAALKHRVEQYRKVTIRGDPEIGCNVLNAPFFFTEVDWIPVPADWARNIVRGKTYDTVEPVALKLWNAVEGRVSSLVQSGCICRRCSPIWRRISDESAPRTGGFPGTCHRSIRSTVCYYGRTNLARTRVRAYPALCGRRPTHN